MAIENLTFFILAQVCSLIAIIALTLLFKQAKTSKTSGNKFDFQN